MKQTVASLHRVTSVALLLVVTLASSWQPLTAAPPNAGLGEDGGQTITLWRIDFDDAAQLNALAAGFDVWEVNHADGYVVAPLTAAQQAQLALQGRRVQRDERTFDLQLPALAPALSSLDAIPGFPCYRTVEKTERDLAALALQYPDFAAWIDIGDSWDKVQPGAPGGYDIHVLVLTNRQLTAPKFRFLLTGAVHAREYVTAEMAARYAEYLLANYGVDPDVTWLLDYGEIHIIPFANPDGRKFAERGYYWRKNTNNANGCSDWYGVDLNRNSSFKWDACEGPDCSSGDACAVTYRGSAPASEPETQAVQTYAEAIFANQHSDAPSEAVPDAASGLFISLHSYGGLVMFPWGWSDVAERQ